MEDKLERLIELEIRKMECPWCRRIVTYSQFFMALKHIFPFISQSLNLNFFFKSDLVEKKCCYCRKSGA